VNKITDHPDIVSFARGILFSPKDDAVIKAHLQECGECRDLVLFVRKTSAMLVQEGRIDRVAKALGMTSEAVKAEMRRGTSIAVLINRPPESPVDLPTHPAKPLSPAKK
jgi:hypothetical protein